MTTPETKPAAPTVVIPACLAQQYHAPLAEDVVAQRNADDEEGAAMVDNDHDGLS
jgi:hypothetical protein